MESLKTFGYSSFGFVDQQKLTIFGGSFLYKAIFSTETGDISIPESDIYDYLQVQIVSGGDI